MKKFTKIEEDLLREKIEAQERFDQNYTNALNKLEEIKSTLEKFKDEYQLNVENWGFAGSLGYVNEQLDAVLEHMESYRPTPAKNPESVI